MAMTVVARVAVDMVFSPRCATRPRWEAEEGQGGVVAAGRDAGRCVGTSWAASPCAILAGGARSIDLDKAGAFFRMADVRRRMRGNGQAGST